VEALLGRGGFGVVYRAVQINIGRAVALKVLLAAARAHADGFARFRREAELAQRLTHPNTVRLFDFGETEQGLPFTAWELLRGRPLDAVLLAEQGLGPPRVARIGAQALKALMEAHSLEIVHRDIKPSNLFLCEFSGERDFLKVLDFGIAKSLTVGPGLTREGSILGTPSYMAPEQVAGEEVSAATDLYALGLVMAEALTGRPVFTGDSGLALCMAQLSAAPAPLPESVLRSPLGPLIARATQKSAPARFSSAAEMLAQLEAVVPTLSASAPVISAFTTGPTALPTAELLAVAATARASSPVTTPPSTGLSATLAAPVKEPSVPPPPVAPAPPPPAPAEIKVTLTSAPALVAAPRPYTPPPEPAALVPADPPRSRALLVLAAAALVVVAVGVAVAVFLYDRSSSPERSVPQPSRSHPAAPGSPAVHHFAQLTNAQIRARIEEAGHHVAKENPTEPLVVWLLEPPREGNVVYLHHCGDGAIAELFLKMYKNRGSAFAAARDGNSVLAVWLTQVPAGAPEALLARLVR
jgi:serine/threonine-protein kinase